MNITIRHLSGPMLGESQELSPALSRVMIGRFPSADIRYPVDMLQVGVEHVELCREGEKYRIELNRYDPVWVNGEQAHNGRLIMDGDELTLGHRSKGPKFSVSYSFGDHRSMLASGKGRGIWNSIFQFFRRERSLMH